MNKADEVHRIFTDCLFRDEELVGGKPNVAPVVAPGLIHPVGFHPDRVAAHRNDIAELLEGFSNEFYADGGGGMSFLNFCLLADGTHWAEHITMEQLCQLGEAIGMVSYPMPREFWDALPGGMPYIVIDRSKKAA